MLPKIKHFETKSVHKSTCSTLSGSIYSMRWQGVQKVQGSRSAYCTRDLWRAFALCKCLSGETALQRSVKVSGQLIGSTVLMPLSVSGCGRLQLRAARLDTSVTLLQVVDNWLALQTEVGDSPPGAPGCRRLSFFNELTWVRRGQYYSIVEHLFGSLFHFVCFTSV